LQTLRTLIRKELALELRRKSVISGVFLYLLSLTFICYLTFSLRLNSISASTWSALFWLVIVFAQVNTIAKSFIGEKKGLTLYFYQLSSPQQVIVSKIIYNIVLSTLLSLLAYVLFSVFIYNPIRDHFLFLITILLTSIGFAATLSMISGIASKTNHSNILMAVLSFPVLISILLMAIRVTKNIVDDLERSASYDELLNLVAINCIVTSLAYILFPYIWRS
jgi:heme exporter protein B